MTVQHHFFLMKLYEGLLAYTLRKNISKNQNSVFSIFFKNLIFVVRTVKACLNKSYFCSRMLTQMLCKPTYMNELFLLFRMNVISRTCAQYILSYLHLQSNKYVKKSLKQDMKPYHHLFFAKSNISRQPTYQGRFWEKIKKVFFFSFSAILHFV